MENHNPEAGPSKPRIPATPPDTPKSRRRSWFGLGSPVVSSSPTTASPTHRKSRDRRGSLVNAEELELSPVGKDRPEQEENLTIDGEIHDETITARSRAKHKKRRSKDGEEGGAVRMEDLGPTKRTSMETDHPPILAPPFETPPTTLPSRLTLGNRSSSLNHTPSPDVPIIFSDKPQPPQPIDRPLPPLPPPDQLKSPPLQVPRGIVVTPSSPRKLVKGNSRSASSSRTDLAILDQRRSKSANRSTESLGGRKTRSGNSSPIGLGLPSALTTDALIGPPVPSKAKSVQSVSSPHPSRPPSPTSKAIAFAEPEQIVAKDKSPDLREGDKKTKVRRARSLSGIFGRSASASSPKPPSRPPSPTHDDELEVLADTQPVTKTQGVLEWLGVKKSSKRRQSEGKLLEFQNTNSPAGESTTKVSGELVPSPDLNTPNNNSTDNLRTGRPQTSDDTSTVTVVPHSGKLAGIFTRRASSRDIQLPSPRPAPSPALSESTSIPAISPRPSAPSSSHSSFRLPPITSDPSSLLNSDTPWMTSPTEEADDLFNSREGPHWGPGIRPWMDVTDQPKPKVTSEQPTPQGGLLGVASEAQKGHNRRRSWSDAPQPSPSALMPKTGSSTHLPYNGTGVSPGTPPRVASRPKLGSRANSGNSAIIDRMKTVFAKSASRGRSNSAASSTGPGANEFGGLRERSNTLNSGRATSPASSHRAGYSNRDGPNASLLDLIDGERRVILNETPQRSPRTSFSGTASTYATESTRNSKRESQMGRPRASTVSFAAPPTSFLPPPSPNLTPSSATPPRRRPSAISRFSSGLFSGPSSPKSGNSLFPLPPRSSGSGSSNFTGFTGGLEGTPSLLSPGTSPRPSTGSISVVTSNASKFKIFREGDESAEMWLEKVIQSVGRDDIAGVLAASGDDFHTAALKLYMSQFDFTHNALDVALRRLLMHMSLPKETQQIDRVIEAFADRYEQCEPGLFEAKDNTYVLAFSMMMLHTDAFNKHNKNKMSKADYVRNTRLDGVPPAVLEVFFDNITFTPFVFIEDDADLHNASLESASSPMALAPANLGSTRSKVDVYHMIVRNLLATLRVDVERYISAENPFSCLGTRPFLDIEGLNRAFVQAMTLNIGHASPGKKGTPILGEKISGRPKTAGGSAENDTVLKITKVGLVSRRDDSIEHGKKSSRKWKSYSVILTGSQLLFFKDPIWALTLLEQARTSSRDPLGHNHLPRITSFKPDEVFSLKDCIAVFGREARLPNTFLLVMPHGRQYFMQLNDEYEMNEWIGLINYAASFKTAGIKMRGGSMDKDQAVLAGAAAAESHKRELRAGSLSGPGSEKTGIRDSPLPESITSTTTRSITPILDPDNVRMSHILPAPIPIPSAGRGALLDVGGANQVALDDGERLEEVFDEVKAELAAGRGGAPRLATSAPADVRLKEHLAARAPVSRVETIQSQIKHFEARVIPLERALQNHLRLARNLAILTPFQKSSRERIASQIPALANKIRNDRLHLSRLRLYITILTKDAEKDSRDWARLRHVALQAANRSLRDSTSVRGIVGNVNGNIAPTPTLSLPDEGSRPESTSPRSGDSPISSGSIPPRLPSPGELPPTNHQRLPKEQRHRAHTHRPSSEQGIKRPANSIQESTISSRSSPRSSSSQTFLRRSSSDMLSPGSSSRGNTMDDSPGMQGTPTMFPLSEPEEDTPRSHRHHQGPNHREDSDQGEISDIPEDGLGRRDTIRPTKLSNATSASIEEKRVEEAELAEEWQKTRAAKRVSLANTELGGAHGELKRLSSLGKRDVRPDTTRKDM